MMNINEKDVNLGLALSSKNYSIRTKLMKNSPGAGVNADSRVDMAFAASDPLSELVWSPHEGLSLRCANSSLADKKPFLLWNVEPICNKDLSPSQSIRSKESGDEEIFGDKATVVRPSRSSSTPELGASPGSCDGTESNGIAEEEAGNKDAIQKDEICTDDAEEDLCRPQNVEIADIAEISKEKRADGINDCKVNVMDLDAPQLNKLESSAENDLCHPTAKDENSPPVERSPTNSKFCAYKENGKEKALSEGDIYGTSSDHDKGNSYESVESCSSAGLFSKGIKRQSYGQELILGSKRMKTSTSISRPDSSFMSWISNMVKGLSDSNNKNDSSSFALTLASSHDVYGKNHRENIMSNKTDDPANLKMGFQTVFQSMYCKTNLSNTGAPKENDSMEESRELLVTETCGRNNDNSCKQIVVANKEVNPMIVGSQYACESDLLENKSPEIPVCNRATNVIPSDSLGKQMNSTAEKITPAVPLGMSDVPEKTNPLTSLWIARLSAKTQENNNCSTYCLKANLDNWVTDVFPIDQKSSEARDDSEKEMPRITAYAEASVDLKSTSKLCPIQPSEKLRSSEAMASVFARRLDALRHIIPSNNRNSSTCSLTCFFCGSDDLRECPDVTEAELDDLLVKLSSSDRLVEAPYLCIRCFKLNHWAISCPLGSSSSQWRSQQNASVVSHYTACCRQTWNMKKSSKLFTSDEIQRTFASNVVNDVKDSKNFPPCNVVTAQDAVAPLEICHAIRNLSLSRADILRWMNSNVSLSHLNGFFLRLRLGKLEAGLGETGYYVACITGDTGEHNGCESKKSISVDVGGIISSVGSQYVSNHDFMEDEIKAWWCRIVTSGCKTPSIDELNSKFNDRKKLGF